MCQLRVIPPINGRTAGPPLGAPPPAGRSGVIPCAGRDGSAPTPGWREGRRDEVLAPRAPVAMRSSWSGPGRGRPGSRGNAGSATRARRFKYLDKYPEDGTFGTDRRLCRRRSQVLQSFRFRGRQVSRRGGRSPCSSQRRARNPYGQWGRRVARAHLVTARPCPRRKPGHQRLSEVVS